MAQDLRERVRMAYAAPAAEPQDLRSSVKQAYAAAKAAAAPEPKKKGLGRKAMELGEQAVGGVVEGVGVGISALGEVSEKLEEKLPRMRSWGALFGGEVPPAESTFLKPIGRAVQEAAPPPRPGLLNQAARGTGRAVALMGAGVGGKLGMAAAGVLATGYIEGEASRSRALAKGADTVVADRAFWDAATRPWTIASGASEMVPIGRIMFRVDRFTGGLLKKAVKNLVVEGAEEAVQEVGSEFVSLLNENLDEEEKRTVRQILATEQARLMRAGLVGAIAVGPLSLVASAVQFKLATPGQEGEAKPGAEAEKSEIPLGMEPAALPGEEGSTLPAGGAPLGQEAPVGQEAAPIQAPAATASPAREVWRGSDEALLKEARNLATMTGGRVSAGLIQREFAAGYAQSARVLKLLQDEGSAERRSTAIQPELAQAEALTRAAPEGGEPGVVVQGPPPAEPQAEAAAAVEPEAVAAKPQDRAPTSVKGEIVDRELSEMGLPPATHAERTTFERENEAAAKRLEEDPFAGQKLLDELEKSGRQASATETALLTRERNRMRLERDQIEDAIVDAHAQGDVDLAADLEARLEKSRNELARSSDISTRAGTVTAQALVQRRMEIKEDYSLARMRTRMRVANRGAALTEAQEKRIDEMEKKLHAALRAFDEHVANRPQPRARNRVAQFVSEQADAARARIKARGTQLYAGLPPIEELADELIVATDYIVKGLSKFADWSSAMVKEFGEGIRPYLQPLFDRASVRASNADVQAAENALIKSIATLEERLATGDVAPKGSKPAPDTPEIARLRARRDELRGEIAKLRAASTPEEQKTERALKTYKTRKRNEARDILERLRENDLAPRQRRELPLDEEAIKLKSQVESAKREFDRAVQAEALKNRTPMEKAAGAAREIFIDLPRALLSSMDLSAPLRQGLWNTLAHPLLTGKVAFPAMFQSALSAERAGEIDTAIRSRPLYALGDSAGLELTELDGSPTKREEDIRSRWSDKIPFVAGSNRAFTMFLNAQRALTFDALVNALPSGKATLAEAKDIANLVNIGTGRGNPGKFKGAVNGLSAILWSPRLLLSRIQLLTGPVFRSGVRGSTPATRKLIAREYGRFLTGAGAVYLLAALLGFEIETDPRSSDFGKLRIGDTRMDPMGGLLQVVTLVSRLASGKTKRSSTGEVVPIRGEDVPYGSDTAWDVITRFLRSKLNPTVGTAADIVTGENVVGEPVTAKSVALNYVPLAWQDVLTAMEEQGVPRGAALTLLSMFGWGLQTYSSPFKEGTKAVGAAKEGDALFGLKAALSSTERQIAAKEEKLAQAKTPKLKAKLEAEIREIQAKFTRRVHEAKKTLEAAPAKG